jgi:protein-S-isoprenylcysteine O-methyltransferase Ste14
MKAASLPAHLRDVLVLPFTVTCIIPYLVYDPQQNLTGDRVLVKIAGILLLGSGLSLFLYTVFLFQKIGKGTLAPWSAKQKLVVVGPYRYCRNPMITGVLFMLMSEALLFHSTNILIWAATFFTINTVYFILSEEPRLLAQFGNEYLEYKKHVPRWFPRFTPYTQGME